MKDDEDEMMSGQARRANASAEYHAIDRMASEQAIPPRSPTRRAGREAGSDGSGYSVRKQSSPVMGWSGGKQGRAGRIR